MSWMFFAFSDNRLFDIIISIAVFEFHISVFVMVYACHSKGYMMQASTFFFLLLAFIKIHEVDLRKIYN